MQVREQRDLIIKVAVISGILSFLVSLSAVGIIGADQIGKALRYVTISATIGAGSSYVLYTIALRLRWIRSMLGVPDFSGRWEGWSYSVARAGCDVLALEVAQNGLTLSIATFSELASSESRTAAIVSDESKTRYSLIFTSDVRIHESNENVSSNHSVTFILRLQTGAKGDILEGEYFSDRLRVDGGRGTQGPVRLAKSSQKPIGGAHYNAERWAMPLPGDWVGKPRFGEA